MVPEGIVAAKLLRDQYRNELENVVESIDMNGVQCSLVEALGHRIIMLSGTNEQSDWLEYNLNMLPSVMKGEKWRWHGGFLHYAQWAYVFSKGLGVTLYLGHSLGGAAASIVAVSNCMPAVTFGAPRALFGRVTPPGAEMIINYVRTDDGVTKVPPSWLGFRHCGKVVQLTPEQPHPGIDHGIQNYIDILEETEAAMRNVVSAAETAHEIPEVTEVPHIPPTKPSGGSGGGSAG
jgi:hypothetical protein